MKKFKKYLAAALLTLLSVLVIGCGDSGGAGAKEDSVLKIGVMPAVDAAPIFIAEKNGYFEELGIDVEIEIYSNPQNRQSALQSGEIDGAMTDFIAVATNVNGGFDIKATTMTDGSFPILAAAGGAEKKEIKVGLMEVSVTNYLVDQWLGADYQVEKVFITEIPARMAALETGDIDMGIFPEPVASGGERKGLTKLIFGAEDEFSSQCMVFTGKAIAAKPETIKAFHEAYNKAVAAINENPEIAKDILIEKIPNTDPEVKELMALPTYREAALPSEEFLQSIIDWTADILKKDLAVSPSDLVEEKFVK